jgi:hypothetical protein
MSSRLSKEELVTELNMNTSELLQVLAQFSKEEFNTIPFEGGWTAGQVAEHLYKSESGVPSLFQTRLVKTERDPDEKTEVIRSVFLDFSTKMKSPDFILPTESEKDPQEMADAFAANRKTVKAIIATADLTQTIADVSFPKLGTFTGLEWICFMSCHSQRHTHQLKKIYERLAAS